MKKLLLIYTSVFSAPAFGQTVACGDIYSLALKNDGTVWAWGYNLYGQLGNGNNTDSNVPVQVNSLTGITSINGGGLHSLALKSDSTVWAWGYNFYGQMGSGNNTDSNVPVQVSSLTGTTAIAGGYSHSLALKNDGTAWAWGNNLVGQLGNGTNNNSNVPVQIIGLCSVLAVNEITEEATVTVYPNPSNGSLTLPLSKGEGIVEVYNMMGELVFSCKLHTTHYELDLRSKSKGIYFIKVIADDKVYSQKVVIE